MRKTQVTVYLDAEQTEALDERARKVRLSRSAYVSRIIAADLADPADLWGDRVVRLEQGLGLMAMTMRELLRIRHPDAASHIAARMDERFGPGTTRELFGEEET